MSQMIAAGEALSLSSLVTPTEGGIASRILAKTSGGSVSLTLQARNVGSSVSLRWSRSTTTT